MENPRFDIVICTYNRAHDLDRCLAALAAQTADKARWRVIVIDNNCTDHTADIVEAHVRSGRIPELRRIVEVKQGVHHARLRGVVEGAGDWVGFVDDDCVLAEDWVAQAIAFAADHPDAGGFSGRVIPNWGKGATPGHLDRQGWLFALQDYGDQQCEVEYLVGAGAVYNRAALAESGWIENPLLEDRTAKGHLSGGDVEISFRVRAAGRKIWFSPGMRLDHLIPRSRQKLGNVLRLAHGLGGGAELLGLMGALDYETWRGARSVSLRKEFGWHFRQLIAVLMGRYAWREWLIRMAFLAGCRSQHSKLATDRQRAERLAGIWPELAPPAKT